MTGIPANVVSVIGGTHTITDVVLTVPTSTLAAGDVMADRQIVANIFRDDDLGGVLESVTVIDPDDTKDAFDLVFLTDDVALGTESSAPNISDADAASIVIANVHILAAGWTDLGGVSVNTVGNLRTVIKPKAGTRDLYIGAIMVTATAQFAGGAVTVRLGVTRD